MDFHTPKVMGIVNVTPDSFYAGSRAMDRGEIAAGLRVMIEEGADILDFGGCSTRPGSESIGEDEEYSRLCRVLEVWKENWPEIPVSIDTYRAGVADRCLAEWGVDIINDIGGGDLDSGIWDVVARHRAVYVLTHSRGTPATMDSYATYGDVVAETISALAEKTYQLRGLGVNDIIIDPGFGFAKTISQNYELLEELGEFCKMGMPVLVGLSRKRMIYELLGITPEDSLEGTIALNTMALERGADILRVHDVGAAVRTIKLTKPLDERKIWSV